MLQSLLHPVTSQIKEHWKYASKEWSSFLYSVSRTNILRLAHKCVETEDKLVDCFKNNCLSGGRDTRPGHSRRQDGAGSLPVSEVSTLIEGN
jgi:hypothetical protein